MLRRPRSRSRSRPPLGLRRQDEWGLIRKHHTSAEESNAERQRLSPLDSLGMAGMRDRTKTPTPHQSGPMISSPSNRHGPGIRTINDCSEDPLQIDVTYSSHSASPFYGSLFLVSVSYQFIGSEGGLGVVAETARSVLVVCRFDELVLIRRCEGSQGNMLISLFCISFLWIY